MSKISSQISSKIHFEISKFDLRFCSFFAELFDFRGPKNFSEAKKFLDPYGANFYKDFSENCNNYFNIPHRNERRGVGGIFFDNLKNFSSIDLGISFLQAMAVTYIESYIKIIKRRRNLDYCEAQKEFQLLRRGRYAEFNLVYDRGTAFGLESNGRIESILSSLPSNVKWSYKKSEEYNLLEKKLLEHINRDWNV